MLRPRSASSKVCERSCKVFRKTLHEERLLVLICHSFEAPPSSQRAFIMGGVPSGLRLATETELTYKYCGIQDIQLGEIGSVTVGARWTLRALDADTRPGCARTTHVGLQQDLPALLHDVGP